MKFQLLYPMAIYALYMWCLAGHLFFTRLRSIQRGVVPAKYFLTYEGPPPPERILRVAQHYDNQFQVPILFFATGALQFAVDRVNALTLALAWAFVASRWAHSWIHLGNNHLRKRAATFAVGWFLLAALWMQLLYFAFTAA